MISFIYQSKKIVFDCLVHIFSALKDAENSVHALRSAPFAALTQLETESSNVARWGVLK